MKPLARSNAPKPPPKRTMVILRGHARVIQRLGRRAIRDIIEIGRRLTDAKDRVGHGKFLTWLAAEFGWSERTAENFMRGLRSQSQIRKLCGFETSRERILSARRAIDAGQGAGRGCHARRQWQWRIGSGGERIIAKSRRGSPLRHAIHIARQVLRDAERNSNYSQILEGRLGDLHRDQVRKIINRKCEETLERREAQLGELQREITRLKAIREWSKGPLLFTPCPNKRGPNFAVPFLAQ
jgi:hypothetical protein